MPFASDTIVPDYASEWEAWRDENVIDVCEVTYSVKGAHLSESLLKQRYTRLSFVNNTYYTSKELKN